MSPAYMAATTPTDGPGWVGITILFLIAIVIGIAMTLAVDVMRMRRRRRGAARRNQAHPWRKLP